jgi:predicted metallopeptidase
MTKRDWRQVVTHEIESFSSKLRVELLPDFTQVDPDELTVVDPTTNETGEGRIFRMDYEKGRQVKPVGRRVFSFMAVRFKNFAPEEPIKVINHSLMMTPRTSK